MEKPLRRSRIQKTEGLGVQKGDIGLRLGAS